jgi:hypothetical protein
VALLLTATLACEAFAALDLPAPGKASDGPPVVLSKPMDYASGLLPARPPRSR